MVFIYFCDLWRSRRVIKEGNKSSAVVSILNPTRTSHHEIKQYELATEFTRVLSNVDEIKVNYEHEFDSEANEGCLDRGSGGLACACTSHQQRFCHSIGFCLRRAMGALDD